MRKSRFSEEQILAILHEHESGRKAAEICERHRISLPTFYGWKTKYGGLSIVHAKRLKQLEGENGTLRRLLATALLDNAVLKSGKSAEADRSRAKRCAASDSQQPSAPTELNRVGSSRE